MLDPRECAAPPKGTDEGRERGSAGTRNPSASMRSRLLASAPFHKPAGRIELAAELRLAMLSPPAEKRLSLQEVSPSEHESPAEETDEVREEERREEEVKRGIPRGEEGRNEGDDNEPYFLPLLPAGEGERGRRRAEEAARAEGVGEKTSASEGR